MRQRRHQGFTLLEMSIVLVIIGLVIGGILVGRDLIRSAEINATIAQFGKYTTAMNSFRLKYNCVAGDCANATAYFPSGSEQYYCPDPKIAPTPRTATMNGSGNGVIDGGGGGDTQENTAVWQHLSNAGFLEGQYSGGVLSGSCGYGYWPGINVPAAKMTSSGTPIPSGYPWYSGGGMGSLMFTWNPTTFTDFWPPPFSTYLYPRQNILMLTSTAASWTSMYGLSSRDAKRIDQKMDDGFPNSGKMVAPTLSMPGAGNCVNNGNYDSSNLAERAACALAYLPPQ